MSDIPAELKYRASHEWVRVEGGIATIGITDHAQAAMGDLVYVELPDVGQTVAAGDEAGVVESVKAASDIYAPISGEIVAINDLLEGEPEKVNGDCYGEGWLFKIEIADEAELETLLTADEYQAKLEDE
ncbi:MAG: glycine cleavage system protein GcvH [Pseudomonadota bacterium]